MGLRTDDRAVTVQIGAILLFAILVILLSIFQAEGVPAENEQVEFDHNQRVQAELQELRNAVQRTAASGSSQPASVSLGTRYPSRVLFVNPPPPAGTLRTVRFESASNLTIENATATGAAADYWTGESLNFSTRALSYRPGYNVYREAPETVLEGSVLYNRFPNGRNLTLTGQTLVDGNRITLVALNGSLSASRPGSLTVDPEPVSTPADPVLVDAGENVTVTLPTRLPVSTWRTLLAEERDPAALSGNDRHVVAVRDGPRPGTVDVVLEPGTYELRLAKVGVGTGVAPEDAHYVVDAAGNDSTVGNATTHRLVVAARDRFGNPVTGATINASLDGNGSIRAQGQGPGTSLSGLATDADGEVTITYEAPSSVAGGSEQVAVDASLADADRPGFDSGSRLDQRLELRVVEGQVGGGGGGGGGGGSRAPTVVSVSAQQTSSNPGGRAEYEVDWNATDADGDLVEVEVVLETGTGTEIDSSTETFGETDQRDGTTTLVKEPPDPEPDRVRVIAVDSGGRTDERIEPV